MQSETKTLNDVKPGDVIYLYRAFLFGRESYSKAKVVKVTPKQIILDNTDRYWKENGQQVSGGRYSPSLRLWSAELEEKIDAKKILAKLQEQVTNATTVDRIRFLNVAQCKAILEVLKPAEESTVN